MENNELQMENGENFEEKTKRLEEELREEIKEIHHVEKEMEHTLHELENLEKKEHEKQIIFVNTREKHFAGKEISFRQVVALAIENPVFNDQIIYTVTYSKGVDWKPKGSLTDNECVHVKNKMVFDVERADKS